MITSVEVRNKSGAVQTFYLTDDSNGYQVRDISGLDPSAASIVTSTLAEIEGETYQTSTTEKRNIVITLGYSPDYVSSSVESLRENLYDFFIPKSWVQLDFKKDTTSKIFRITGYVETMDSPLFTNDPVATISILCLDPFFINPSMIARDDAWYNEYSDTATIDYEGTAPTGIEFYIFGNVPTDQINLMNTDRDLVLSTFYVEGTRDVSETGTSFVAGSKVTINTNDRKKDVTLQIGTPGESPGSYTFTGAVTRSILKTIGKNSVWIKLTKGLNTFVVSVVPSGSPSTFMYRWRLSYYERFSGL